MDSRYTVIKHYFVVVVMDSESSKLICARTAQASLQYYIDSNDRMLLQGLYSQGKSGENLRL